MCSSFAVTAANNRTASVCLFRMRDRTSCFVRRLDYYTSLTQSSAEATIAQDVSSIYPGYMSRRAAFRIISISISSPFATKDVMLACASVFG